MLALQFHPSESDFILKKDIPKPTLDEENDDVLIKVEYAGLCGTDVHIVKVCFLFIRDVRRVPHSCFTSF